MQWWTQKVKSDFEPPCNNICKVCDWQREPTFFKKEEKKAKMSFRKPGEVILKTASRKLIQENSICVEELRWYYQIFIFWFIWIVDAVFLPYILCFHVCLYMFLINNELFLIFQAKYEVMGGSTLLYSSICFFFFTGLSALRYPIIPINNAGMSWPLSTSRPVLDLAAGYIASSNPKHKSFIYRRTQGLRKYQYFLRCHLGYLDAVQQEGSKPQLVPCKNTSYWKERQ